MKNTLKVLVLNLLLLSMLIMSACTAEKKESEDQGLQKPRISEGEREKRSEKSESTSESEAASQEGQDEDSDQEAAEDSEEDNEVEVHHQVYELLKPEKPEDLSKIYSEPEKITLKEPPESQAAYFQFSAIINKDTLLMSGLDFTGRFGNSLYLYNLRDSEFTTVAENFEENAEIALKQISDKYILYEESYIEDSSFKLDLKVYDYVNDKTYKLPENEELLWRSSYLHNARVWFVSGDTSPGAESPLEISYYDIASEKLVSAGELDKKRLLTDFSFADIFAVYSDLSEEEALEKYMASDSFYQDIAKAVSIKNYGDFDAGRLCPAYDEMYIWEKQDEAHYNVKRFSDKEVLAEFDGFIKSQPAKTLHDNFYLLYHTVDLEAKHDVQNLFLINDSGVYLGKNVPENTFFVYQGFDGSLIYLTGEQSSGNTIGNARLYISYLKDEADQTEEPNAASESAEEASDDESDDIDAGDSNDTAASKDGEGASE